MVFKFSPQVAAGVLVLLTAQMLWSTFMACITRTPASKAPPSDLEAQQSLTRREVKSQVSGRNVSGRVVLRWSMLLAAFFVTCLASVVVVTHRRRSRRVPRERTQHRASLNGSVTRSAAEEHQLFDEFSPSRPGATTAPATHLKVLSDYETARNGCRWLEADNDVDSDKPGSFDYMFWQTDQDLKADYWGDLTSWMMTGGAAFPKWQLRLMNLLFRPPQHGPPLKSFFCIANATSGKDQSQEEWRIRRLGPFIGTGGFDWHRIKIVDPFELRNFAGGSSGNGYSVTSHFLGPVSSSGELLGNPPIHIHHANLIPQHKSTNFSRLGQWHGDSQCLDSNGGTACYLRHQPEGYGYSVAGGVPLYLDADMNDVRPSGSPELEFFLETAVRVQPKPPPSPQEDPKALKEVGVLILGTPARSHWWSSTDFAGTYFVPANKASALWCTARMPVSGTFVSGHQYTHQGLLQEAFVFSGVSPQGLGLNLPEGPFQMDKPWEPWLPQSAGWVDGVDAMASLRDEVMSRFLTLQESCLEREKAGATPCPSQPRLVFHINQTSIDPTGVARQMPWPDTPWTFEAGDQYTTVILHKPMAGSQSDASHSSSIPTMPMQQHFAFHGTYVPLPGEAAESHYVLPTLDADWAWIDTPNSFLLFTHFGGPPVCVWNLFMVVLAALLLVLVLSIYKKAASLLMGFLQDLFPSVTAK